MTIASTYITYGLGGGTGAVDPHIEHAKRSSCSPIIVQGQADMTVDWPHNLDVLDSKFAPQGFYYYPRRAIT